jgi:hypothetical protein
VFWSSFNLGLNWRGVLAAIAIVAIATALQHPALAQNRAPIFSDNSPHSIFNQDIYRPNDSDIQFLPYVPKPKNSAKTAENAKSDLTKTSQENPANSSIIDQFGDPNEDEEIKPIDNAPKPFKGMMAALNSGQDELAFQYAKKYVRYLKTLQDRNQEITGYVGKAMVREGMAGSETWISNKEYAKQQELLDKDLERSKTDKSGDVTKSTNDERVRALVDRARQDEDRSASLDGASSENEARLRAREALSLKVPVAKDGKVDAYVFLKLADTSSQKMAQEIEKLNRSVSKEHGVNLVVFSVDKLSNEQLQAFSAQYQLSYQVQPGDVLAKNMKVTSTPATILIQPATGYRMVEQGAKNFFYLDELIKIMQGRSAS